MSQADYVDGLERAQAEEIQRLRARVEECEGALRGLIIVARFHEATGTDRAGLREAIANARRVLGGKEGSK